MEKDNHDPPKIFIGGLPSRGITTRKLRSHFARYGNVVEAVAMEHPDGLGRGFGFVEYEDEAAVLRALDSRESVNHDTFFRCRVDVKRAEKKETISAQISATSNSNAGSKIFVGGLRDNITKDHLINYFGRFGTITDAVVMSDRQTGKARGFGFVTFDSKEATDEVLKDRFHYLNGIRVETKNAEPRDRRRYQNGHSYESTDMANGKSGTAIKSDPVNCED
uniref:RRM domain-containing protein n=1 Tax=Zea mays TaxID=4577 RepID=A0A804M4Q3_MAIZE